MSIVRYLTEVTKNFSPWGSETYAWLIYQKSDKTNPSEKNFSPDFRYEKNISKEKVKIFSSNFFLFLIYHLANIKMNVFVTFLKASYLISLCAKLHFWSIMIYLFDFIIIFYYFIISLLSSFTISILYFRVKIFFCLPSWCCFNVVVTKGFLKCKESRSWKFNEYWHF